MSYRHTNIFLIFALFLLLYKSNCAEKYNFYRQWQREKLEKACKNEPIFCNMMLAIEDVFYQIQEEEIRIENIFCDQFCLLYNNIRARDMLCETIETNTTKIEGLTYSHEIIFRNCSVLLSGEIGYDNKNYKPIMLGNFLSELKFDSLTFNHTTGSKSMELNFENATVKYNYDRNSSWFQSWEINLKSQMDDILESVYDDLIMKIRDKLIPELRRPNIFDETLHRLFEQYTIFKNSVRLFDKTKKLTYLSYNKTYMVSKEQLIIKDKIFLHNFMVYFEYALNYNITYNDGSFLIRNLCFEADEHKDNNYYDEEISEMTKFGDFNKYNNSLELWEVIVNDFKKKFNENKIQKDDINTRSMKFF